MNYKVIGSFFGVLLFLSITTFLGMVLIIILNPSEGSLEVLVERMRDSVLGNLVALIPGVLSIIFAAVLVLLWFSSEKWKDLRFKMAFYLYHSKVQKDDVIPLEHLAKVAVCSLPDITKILEKMIMKDELKGIVDREKRIYIHKGLTKRTMRILTALPPARVHQLDDVKKWALKGSSAYEGHVGIEELETVEIEELPSVSQELMNKQKERTVPCPECGKLNRRKDHFCTYCGEVIN